jgi:hypothetical protein
VEWALLVLVAINLVLPLRHYVADGNVRFNDDGYYMSWRVMLTERATAVRFEVSDPASGERWTVWPDEELADWQLNQGTTRPDLILATAHLVAERYPQPVEVRGDVWVAFNGHPRQRWINPTVDLAAVARTAPADTFVLDLSPPVTT